MNLDTLTTIEQPIALERLKKVYELTGALNASLGLPQLLEFVINQCLILSQGRSAILLLSNRESPPLHRIAAAQGEPISQPAVESVLDVVNRSIIPQISDQNQLRFITGQAAATPYEHLTGVDRLHREDLDPGLLLPLVADKQWLGVVYIDQPEPAVIESEDLIVFNTFAYQAGQAIARLQEHQRQIDGLTRLNSSNLRIVRALDLNELLIRVAQDVTRILDVEASSVLLFNKSQTRLSFAASVMKDRPLTISTQLRKGQGIAGWVAARDEVVCVNNIAEEPRWFGEVEAGFETTSLLCVPLHLDDRVVGVLQAVNKRESHGNFDAGDMALLSGFADAAAVAIENAQLYQEARQAHQLRALNEVALKLSSILDLDKVLDEGLTQSLDVLKAEAGALNLINDQTHTDLLTVQLSQGFGADPTQTTAQSRALTGLASWMLTQNINNYLVDDVFVIGPNHAKFDSGTASLSEAGVEAVAVAPIIVNDAIRGGIAIISTSPHAYTAEEVGLLSSIGRIIGLAAQNTIHYIQMQAKTLQLTYLNDIGSALTRSLELDRVLQMIIEGVNTLLQTELTSVFLINEETNELVLSYSTKGMANIRLPAPWQGIAGWVARHDKPALVNNTHSDPRHLHQIAIETGLATHSILCVPLKVEGQVIGVVEVLNKTGGQQFTHAHQSQLLELTKWAAIALHNARLFDERVQAYEHLNTEQQRRSAAETRGAMAAVILDMAHTMNNVVGAIRVWASSLEQAARKKPQAPLSTFEKALRHIRQNAEEAIKLMSTMTGPLEEVALAPTNVHTCLDAALQACWWPDNIQLIKIYGAGIPPAKANSQRLEAVFHNLLSNAIQALTQAGGEIRIETSQTESGQAKIVIADTGPGIPPELRQQVFDPGVSGTDGGLGIGLWLVETFVHQFEGQIDYDSSATAGTTFTVTLQPMPDSGIEDFMRGE